MEAQSLDEVRANMDRLDREIVRLMAERGAFVRQAARFKASRAEVEAPGRVEQVVATVRALAAGAGLEPGVAEAAYRAWSRPSSRSSTRPSWRRKERRRPGTEPMARRRAAPGGLARPFPAVPPRRAPAAVVPLALLLWCGPGAALEPARLGEGPDRERCLALLRTDPDEALLYAGGWEAAGGGEGARYCAALSLLALGDTERGAERLEDLARSSGADSAARAALFAEAGSAWTLAGEPDRAFAAATMALTLAPDDPVLMLDRALALGAMGRYAEALEDLDRAVEFDPYRAEAWALRGAAKRQLGRAEDAERDVARALSLAPDNADALLERGALRQAKGDTRGARADWERAARAAPDSGAAELARRNLELNPAPPPPPQQRRR